MRKASAAICLMASATLALELSLIRTFDVLFYPNIAYMIVTSALFSLGLGGVYSVLRPPTASANVHSLLAKWSVFFSLAALAIFPIVNTLPFDFNKIADSPWLQLTYFAVIYLALALPFFFSGMIFSNLFSAYVHHIQSLYFWDLTGAALGSILIIPLIRVVGPGGFLFFAAAFGMFASALFIRRSAWAYMAPTIGLGLIAAPLLYAPSYFDFVEHQDKRGVRVAREQGMIMQTLWDPVSKIDVINYGWMHYIAYDGGSQNSIFYPFDGDYQSLRDNLSHELTEHFWLRGVLASHYLKRDTDAKVLIVGSAGGQEVKAALMYGASEVDGIELVQTVVELGQNEYAEYIGNLFQHPSVNIMVGEGRSYLRSTDEKYDIIQIFSNHTSSSIASGTGAIATTYLQTAEAYQEYFSHLTETGILHINHHVYPRMITTAALAWHQMGRADFQKHVVVFQRGEDDTLPTFLVKMQPWSEAELLELKEFFFTEFPGENNTYQLVEDPLRSDESSLSADFFLPTQTREIADSVDYRITPTTDNRPYFNFTRKSFNPFSSENGLIHTSIANVPLDIAPLFITGAVSFFYALIFTLLPLRFSETGRVPWCNKGKTLIYFSCLGLGFIMIELVLIQIFMRLIGSPLYTYSAVIFILLLGAGLGSLVSPRLGITPDRRWYWPFFGILISGTLLLAVYPTVFEASLATPLAWRLAVAVVLILPIGFFLGMPFPLGILTLRTHPQGAIAWAWGMNGLFTAIGGLAMVVISIELGFNVTLLIAFLLYIGALLLFLGMKRVPAA